MSDLDLPIALRKGKRSCATAHPLCNVLTYSHLSLAYCPSLSSISSVFIPNSSQEALAHPCWVLLLLMRCMLYILMVLGILFLFLLASPLLDVIWCLQLSFFLMVLSIVQGSFGC